MALVYKCSSATGNKYLPSLLKYGHCPLLKCPAALLPVMPWTSNFLTSTIKQETPKEKVRIQGALLSLWCFSSTRICCISISLPFGELLDLTSLHLHLPGPLPQQPAALSAVNPKQPIPSPFSPTPAPISLECQRHCAVSFANLLPPFCCQLPLPGILVRA